MLDNLCHLSVQRWNHFFRWPNIGSSVAGFHDSPTLSPVIGELPPLLAELPPLVDELPPLLAELPPLVDELPPLFVNYLP